MTVKKITVSLPEDVVAQLASVENVSAYVTDALRRTRDQATVLRRQLITEGIVTEEGIAHARAKLLARRAARAERRAREAREAADAAAQAAQERKAA
jgi:hypothetical protein